MRGWTDAGKLTQCTTVIDGCRELPPALVKLFQGYNTGKLMVKTWRGGAPALRSPLSEDHFSGAAVSLVAHSATQPIAFAIRLRKCSLA